jgi:hypothetical protein
MVVGEDHSMRKMKMMEQQHHPINRMIQEVLMEEHHVHHGIVVTVDMVAVIPPRTETPTINGK